MTELVTLTPEQIKVRCLDYLNTLGFAKNLTDGQKTTFIEIAQAMHLNPFIREIYAVGYKSGEIVTLSIITGYETFIKRADRTGKVANWRTFINADGDSECHIYRKDWDKDKPFVHVLDKNEFVGTSPIWKNKKFMHKKVCTAQAFRLCFPDEMGGLPYTEAEEEYEHGLPTKPFTADDKLKEKREKANDEVTNLYGNVDKVPRDVWDAIANASSQVEINGVVIKAMEDTDHIMKPEIVIEPEPVVANDNEETIEYIRECIVKAWDLLAYNFTHKNNSVKKNLDIDDYKQLSEIDDVPLLKGYREHLREEYKKKGAK
jgi:hypothetical protein